MAPCCKSSWGGRGGRARRQKRSLFPPLRNTQPLTVLSPWMLPCRGNSSSGFLRMLSPLAGRAARQMGLGGLRLPRPHHEQASFHFYAFRKAWEIEQPILTSCLPRNQTKGIKGSRWAERGLIASLEENSQVP